MEIYPAPPDPNWDPGDAPVETRVAEPNLSEVRVGDEPARITGSVEILNPVNAAIE